jgi:predicted NBD/HSP70 family sugar kinase/biotin operon repressor
MASATSLIGRSSGNVGQDRTQAEVFATIVTRGPVSRRDLARLTGLSQSTITKVVKPMLERGYVVEDKEEVQGPGRPVVPLRVNNDRHYVVGAKVTQRELVAGVTDPQAQPLAARRARRQARGPAGAASELAALVEELLDDDSSFRTRVEGLGVALGGHVDAEARVLRYSPILGWRDVPFAAMLEERSGLATIVENDVDALAIAEQWFGAGQGVADFAVVTVGAGVGCALVVDNELMLGATGLAGELGHIVIDPNGAECSCGNRGCLETVAADGAIVAAVGAAGGRARDVANAAELARAGDPAARAAFARAGEALGRGISILLTLFNPARVIVSGEGVVASDLFVETLERTLGRHAFSTAATDCELVTRPLEDETWARGAAATVLRHLIARPARGRATVVA